MISCRRQEAISGNISWGNDENQSPAVEFRAEVVSMSPSHGVRELAPAVGFGRFGASTVRRVTRGVAPGSMRAAPLGAVGVPAGSRSVPPLFTMSPSGAAVLEPGATPHAWGLDVVRLCGLGQRPRRSRGRHHANPETSKPQSGGKPPHSKTWKPSCTFRRWPGSDVDGAGGGCAPLTHTVAGFRNTSSAPQRSKTPLKPAILE